MTHESARAYLLRRRQKEENMSTSPCASRANGRQTSCTSQVSHLLEQNTRSTDRAPGEEKGPRVLNPKQSPKLEHRAGSAGGKRDS